MTGLEKLGGPLGVGVQAVDVFALYTRKLISVVQGGIFFIFSNFAMHAKDRRY